MINADATMGRIGGECDDRDEDGTNEDGIVDNSDATILAILLDHDATNAPADDNGKEDPMPTTTSAAEPHPLPSRVKVKMRVLFP